MHLYHYAILILIGLIIGMFVLAYFGDRVVPTMDEHEDIGGSNG
jgi:uncharacterized membrane protein YdjX (TVP38/TMEM64 family)